jgi:tetratricopeptide (TPR) repeat protein
MSKRSMIIVTAFGGLILLTASAFVPWTQVPMASPVKPYAMVLAEPSITIYYKLGCQIIVMIAFLVLDRRVSRGHAVATVAACWLVALLMYPYFVTVWEPRLSAEAAWLELQHENLTWTGGDIGTGSEFTSAPLKSPIYPVDPPNRFAVFNLPHSYPSEFEMGKLSDLSDWFGFTEAFCQFSRIGWFLALFGTLGVLGASCIAEHSERRRIGYAIRVVFFVGGSAAAIAWSLAFRAGWHVRSAETAVRQGQFEEALKQLDDAESALPVLRHDTYLIAQRGCLYNLTGQSDRLEAHLYRATMHEREGRLPEANQLYRTVLRDAPADDPCRREACRAVLRDAIHALNSGSIEPAIEQLREVLAVEPANIKAIYVLQLACVRSGRTNEMHRLVDQLEFVYGCFQHPLKDTVRCASYHNGFVSALEQDDLTAAIEARRKSQSP